MRRLFSILVFASLSVPVLAQQAAPPMTPPASLPPSGQRPVSAPPPVAAPSMQQPTTAPPRAQGQQAPPAPGVQTPRPGHGQQLPPPGVQTPRPAQGQTAPPAFTSGQSSWQNIKLEITIADSLIPDTPARKAVSLLIADGRNGQVRGSGSVDGLINIDARPTLHRDGRIFLQLTMEYKPELPTQQTAGSPRVTTFSESLALMLQDGVSIVASESSDPRSDRKVTVTLRASVQK
jgi:hypothetical protein